MKRCRGTFGLKILLWILILFCLAGCTNWEMEKRSFPTALVVREAGMEVFMEEWENQSRHYLDYGHVKAVVISKDLVPDMQSLKEILAYLEKRPVFARNILVFAAEEEALTAVTMRLEESGIELQKFKSVQLGDLLNFWHNHEPMIEVPVLGVENSEWVLEGSVLLENGAIPSMGIPVAAKVEE